MAELKIEKRRRFPVFWTVLAILAIAVIAWIIVDDNDVFESEEMAMTEEDRTYDVESGYAENDRWNGNVIDPWAGDTVWDEEETWGDESDVAEDQYSNEEDDNTFGGDYSGAIGTDVAAPDTALNSKRIRDFISFTENLDNSDLNRRQAHEGLSKLAAALTALTTSDMQSMNGSKDTSKTMRDDTTAVNQSGTNKSTTGLDYQARRLRQQIDQLKDNRMAGMQASVIRSSFMEAATIFQELQYKHYPELQKEASEVMDAAQDINAQETASSQSMQIKRFFDEAADALEKATEQETTAQSNS
ncbi:MAG TPA: hypothetical protein VKA10_01965 [Prolixibacteraceae bacterium]|nr:hypothetical protein [Prolixibacteraceae bacterium]